MDAHGLVSLAVNWTTVPPQLNCTVSRISVNRLIPSNGTLKVTASLTDLSHVCRGSQINFLEHVQVRVSLNYTLRGYLEMSLTSPQGSTSLLLQSRTKDNSPYETYLTNWTILTLHHWGENPLGTWELALKNSRPDQESEGILFDWILMIYGTTTDPLDGHLHVQIPTGPVLPHETKGITVQPEDNQTTNLGSTFAPSSHSALVHKMGSSGLAMKAFAYLFIGFSRIIVMAIVTWWKNKRPTQIENGAQRG
ncbi:neuroendocrine convertase 2-like isoform X1 [Stylophora pistillata]|uniref:neuroendocrine convertase 2-like isoform X1 n=1 Tax=Stylophora pistillata TaxID=50429 RepID=UPI000C0531AB|nr:neuroendocrine convertase 2-like isoform X1 [Stylophora pistillata]